MPEACLAVNLVHDGGGEKVDEDLLPFIGVFFHLFASVETAAGESGRTALFPRRPGAHLLHLLLHLYGKHLARDILQKEDIAWFVHHHERQLSEIGQPNYLYRGIRDYI